MTRPVKVKIWTGFGPHPELDLDKSYHKLLYVIFNLIDNLVRKAAIGSKWIDKKGQLEEQEYLWTIKGWKQRHYDSYNVK